MQMFNKIGAVCALTAFFTVGCSSVTKTVSDTAQALTTMHTKKVVDVNEVTAAGVGKKLGTISFQDSDKGLIITPALADLPNGTRGFHIHENASCEPAVKDGKAGAALAAGSHYNPNKAPHHGTPTTGH